MSTTDYAVLAGMIALIVVQYFAMSADTRKMFLHLSGLYAFGCLIALGLVTLGKLF